VLGLGLGLVLGLGLGECGSMLNVEVRVLGLRLWVLGVRVLGLGLVLGLGC